MRLPGAEVEGVDPRVGDLLRVVGADSASGHDRDAARRRRDQRAECPDAFERRVAAARGEDAPAACPYDRFERLVQVARHVEGPVERDGHRTRLGDERRRARQVDAPVGRQQPQDHAVGPARAGETDLLSHLFEFGVGVEEVAAPRPDHDAQLQAGNGPRHADGGGRRRGAAFGRSGAELDAPGAAGACRFAGGERVGADFGFDRFHLRFGLPAAAFIRSLLRSALRTHGDARRWTPCAPRPIRSAVGSAGRGSVPSA